MESLFYIGIGLLGLNVIIDLVQVIITYKSSSEAAPTPAVSPPLLSSAKRQSTETKVTQPSRRVLKDL